MGYACYFDDIIMEAEGEKSSGSLTLRGAESQRTTPDFHHTEKDFTKKDLSCVQSTLAVLDIF